MITRIVTYSDMEGRYKLDLPSDKTDWNDFVDEMEYKILIDLFGASLYSTFDDDENATIWTNLLNGVDNYTDYAGYKKDWKGLKKMFVRLLFAEWVLLNQHTQTGIVQAVNENSTPLTAHRVKNISNDAYNEFVREYYNAWNYMYSNYSSYSEFDLYFKEKAMRGMITSQTVR